MSLDIRTYSACVSALALDALGPTDAFTISGVDGAQVRIQRIRISGAGAAGGLNLHVVKRSSLNSGGTSTTPNKVPHDSNDDAAQAIVKAYTANPTSLGTSLGDIRAERLPLTVNGIGGISFEFGNFEGKPLILNGASELVAVNLAGGILIGATMSASIEWTEQ